MTTQRGIQKTLLVVEEFRKLHSEMPMQIAAAFLMIAQKPRISLADLRQQLGQGKSSVLRNVGMLQDKWGLVTYGRDPLDSRNNIAWLTPAGERLVRSLAAYVGEETE
jgi:DNA-binding MarR family transcriptional regulator